MKKTLSIVLAVIICVSSMSLSFSAFAATKKTVAITLSGTQYGGIIESAISSINESRASYSMPSLELDATLTSVAEKRAAEIMLYADSVNDSRPDGSSITTLLSGYGITEFTAFGTLYQPTADRLETELYELKNSSFALVQSIGIGVFEYKDTYVYYAVLSKDTAVSAPYCSTRSESYKVNVAISNFSKKGIEQISKGKGKYSLTTKFYADGYYGYYVAIPNSQVTYSSSNSKILKIKGSNCYIKKNGKFTLSSKLKDGTVIYSETVDFDGFNDVKPSISKLVSSKKKTLKATWSANVNDADGYQVQYSTDKKFKKGVKSVNIKGKKNTSKTIKKLKSKKTYYVRVRAYIDQGDGEKAYTKWSKVKSVKVK